MMRRWLLVVLLPLAFSVIEVRDYINDADINYYYGSGGVSKYGLATIQQDPKSQVVRCSKEKPFSTSFQPQLNQ